MLKVICSQNQGKEQELTVQRMDGGKAYATLPNGKVIQMVVEKGGCTVRVSVTNGVCQVQRLEAQGMQVRARVSCGSELRWRGSTTFDIGHSLLVTHEDGYFEIQYYKSA